MGGTMYNESLRIKKFKTINDKNDLLYILNISNEKYNYLIYKKQYPYMEFYLQKKSGGVRRILAPCSDLKKVQRDLNVILMNNYNFNDEIVHGFIKNHSIKTNAIVHKDAKYIVNIDLKNFFDTIHFGRVRGMFMGYPFEFSNYVATNLAKIACYEKKLPQGAPTSPTISNIICYRMDRELMHLCKKYKCKYTRYADDITISTKMLKLPIEIAKFEDNNTILSDYITSIIKKEGFIINHEKLKIRTTANRQEVTGLIVNKKINVKKIYIKNLRAILHNVSKYGFYLEGCKYFQGIKITDRDKIEKKFINVLKGKIEFLKMIRGIGDYVYIKYATEFNNLTDTEYFDTDYGLSMKDFIEKRTFPLISYDEMSQGTCFMAENIGIITSTHVLVNKESFFSEEKYKEMLEKEKIYLDDFKMKPFYLLSHNNKKYPISGEITKEQINTDICILRCATARKKLRINTDYKPEIGEKVYLAGYGEFNGYSKSTINYIEGKITGYDNFFGNKYACINTKIYHGMSGGPVLNKNREVIGIIYVGFESDETQGIISKHNGFITFYK